MSQVRSRCSWVCGRTRCKHHTTQHGTAQPLLQPIPHPRCTEQPLSASWRAVREVVPDLDCAASHPKLLLQEISCTGSAPERQLARSSRLMRRRSCLHHRTNLGYTILPMESVHPSADPRWLRYKILHLKPFQRFQPSANRQLARSLRRMPRRRSYPPPGSASAACGCTGSYRG